MRFDETGRHNLRRKRERGSVFEGYIKLTNDELKKCCDAVVRLIPPDGIVTTFNGAPLAARQAVSKDPSVLLLK